MTKSIAIFGAGGFGRSLFNLIRYEAGNKYNIFLVDDDSNVQREKCFPYDVVSLENLNPKTCSVIPAVSNTNSRLELAQKIEAHGFMIASYIAQTACIFSDSNEDDSLVACQFSTIGCDVRFGKCLHLNAYSYLEHDSTVGDFVTLAPGAKVNGGVMIGDYSYIGSGAVVKQGVKIGNRVTIGMGAVVVADVADGCTVVGNPALRQL